ncbi:metal ABC transporter substrate-binding protein [Ornithinimicrobium panacihumi]|uniref:metal ABC transporter substrate-binding protein n=1 Tax=Ornithinimicrobium panacihumi TaxID=2008449 RepID=UPI003F8C6248
MQLRLLSALVPLGLILTACGGGSAGTPTEGAGATDGSGEQLTVITSFYPLEYLTSRIAGDRAQVQTLTGAGADPHEVELTPKVVGSLGSADLVVYSAGMQPAVDEAVAQQAADHSLDVAPVADLLALGESEDEHSGHADDEDGSEDAHAGHDHGPEDPHFWLDPERYGHVAETIAEQLASLDPDHGQGYTDRAAEVVAELEALDEEFAAGLATCQSRDLVTTHEAFGYLAHRYDLHQTGITGISPESEPSPARLAEVSAQIERAGVTTVFAEPILTDAIARTVATETGAQVLTLDPLEGITSASAGTDYSSVMRANLEALQEGLGCS